MALASQRPLRFAALDRELAPSYGPLLRAIQDAHTNANRLFASDSLNSVVDRIAATAIEHGHDRVYGSSTFGHMLVGALVCRWPTLSPWVPGTTSNILLIDGPLVGTSGLMHAAETAKAMGAENVDALTAGSPPNLPSPANAAIDRFWILGLD